MLASKKRDYEIPIFHMETLDDEESINIAKHFIDGLHCCKVAFCAVFYNEEQDNINVHAYNIGKKESKAIYDEVCSMDELKDYEITLEIEKAYENNTKTTARN